jgi:hypothetical protein
MPVVINIAANLLFGAGLALVARRSPALRQTVFSWPFFFLLAFEAVLFTPVATYVFRFYPQWSMLYWLDPQVFPALERWIGWLSMVAILLNFAAALGGYLAARLGIITNQVWMWSAPLVAATGLILYVGIAYWDRVAFVGDYDAFWQGNAVLMLMAPPGIAGMALYAAAIAFVAWTKRTFGDHDPRLL